MYRTRVASKLVHYNIIYDNFDNNKNNLRTCTNPDKHEFIVKQVLLTLVLNSLTPCS